MSDDGEPDGAFAAAPIRAAIEGAEFVDRAVIVTLSPPDGAEAGAGGLIRAYGQAARDC